jgi:predicted nucleotidyltransferase
MDKGITAGDSGLNGRSLRPIGRSEQAQRLYEQRGALLDASRSYGARDVRVFGSVARHDERPDSDIDLLVELDTERTLLDLVAFGREASEILGMPVDVATADMLPDGAEHARSESFAL